MLYDVFSKGSGSYLSWHCSCFNGKHSYKEGRQPETAARAEGRVRQEGDWPSTGEILICSLVQSFRVSWFSGCGVLIFHTAWAYALLESQVTYSLFSLWTNI